jgi:hypothetical protein
MIRASRKSSMNLRHAAALALVGWYLMLPPMVGNHTDTSAPLNSWRMTASYDAAIDCRKVLEDSIRDSEKALQDPHLLPFTRAASLQFLDAACVATDDPRLKEK